MLSCLPAHLLQIVPCRLFSIHECDPGRQGARHSVASAPAGSHRPTPHVPDARVALLFMGALCTSVSPTHPSLCHPPAHVMHHGDAAAKRVLCRRFQRCPPLGRAERRDVVCGQGQGLEVPQSSSMVCRQQLSHFTANRTQLPPAPRSANAAVPGTSAIAQLGSHKQA